MQALSDLELIISYEDAIKMQLDEEFIKILLAEVKKRNLELLITLPVNV
jgi:hypothetical protein